MTLAERAVLRIREEMTERHVSQRDLADRLKCSQGRIAKILNGGASEAA
jgi:transcriptional regulator with XRE-family HTH domain